MPNSNFMSDANATTIFTAYATAIKLGLKAWIGTTAEWDQLTDAQKKQYQVNFKTDDCSGESIEVVKKSIADDFSINVNYNKGEYCYHLGDLYKFTSAHTAGAWSAADVEQVQVGDEIGELKNTLTSVEERIDANVLSDVGTTLTLNTEYVVPADGYLRGAVNPGSSKYISLFGKRTDGTWYILAQTGDTTIISPVISLFVRKGMSVRFSGSSSTDVSCYFIPLISNE